MKRLSQCTAECDYELWDHLENRMKVSDLEAKEEREKGREREREREEERERKRERGREREEERGRERGCRHAPNPSIHPIPIQFNRVDRTAR